MTKLIKNFELWFYRRFNLIVYISAVLLTIAWFYSLVCQYQYRYLHRKSNLVMNITLYEEPEVLPELRMKYILEWIGPFTTYPNWNPGKRTFVIRKCKVHQCLITTDKSFLQSIEHFDALLFNGHRTAFEYVSNPVARSPHQKYIFVSVESSNNYAVCDTKYDNFFNWTWTYRLDSEVSGGVIIVRDKNGNIIGPNKTMHWIDKDSMIPIDNRLKERLNTKSKAAAWIVNNCKTFSDRKLLIHKIQLELDKYGLRVDIYGPCTGYNCYSRDEDCFKMISRHYYFYFAVEDIITKDLVSESLLFGLQNLAVPIVFGGANYSRFMPDGIYLHGGKLKPKDLAKEMYDIIQDKERYYSFFKWRNHYSYHDRDSSPDTDDHCKMCAMLHDEDAMNKTTVYRNFRKWWNTAVKC